MRVLITTDTVGGVWTFTRELTAGLLEHGSSVALVSLGRAPSAEQAAWVERVQATAGERFGFMSLEVPLEWEQENANSFLGAAPGLERLCEDFSADIVHASQFCFGALAVRVPVLVTAHSDVLSWAVACRGDQLPNTPWLRQYRALVQRGLEGATAVAAPTRWMLDALGAGFALPARSFSVPNGRSLERTPKNGRGLRAVSAGRLWDEGKNLKILTEIEPGMPLSIAGELPPEQVPAGLQFMGPLEEKDLLELFEQSAIYLCVSRYEPFGLAPLEAALCGCAVVANDIPPLREVWGDAALYFSGAAALERVLAMLKEDPVLLEEVQRRCLARAGDFSRGRMTTAYHEIYRDMLQAWEGPSLAA